MSRVAKGREVIRNFILFQLICERMWETIHIKVHERDDGGLRGKLFLGGKSLLFWRAVTGNVLMLLLFSVQLN